MSSLLALATEQFGRRRKITRDKMRDFLARLEVAGMELGRRSDPAFVGHDIRPGEFASRSGRRVQ